MKIYTKKGDSGQTSLFGGQMLPKHHVRIEAYGTLDELNAQIGLLHDQRGMEDFRHKLKSIQDLLFCMGSELASPPELVQETWKVKEANVLDLEQQIDQMEAELPPLRNFLIPGGHVCVSQCHVCRTVCRRAERCLVRLAETEGVRPELIRFLNRLSDYLFVFARFLARHFGAEELKWVTGS